MKEVQEILENRRRKNKNDLDARRKEIFTKFPRMKEIDALLKEKNLSRISLSLASKDVSQISKEIEDLNGEFTSTLIDNSYPQDYLQLKYHCDICKDTGADGTQICACKRQLMTQKMYEDTGIQDIIREENFDNFDLSLFRKNRQENEPISPYENIKQVKEELYAYASNFDHNSVNLYIFGDVGTGKTYLLNSITKEVLDQGYSVLYLSESDLINTLIDHRFSYGQEKIENTKKVETIYNSDLLVIDDLGTYTTNDQTKSALFEALNTRLVKKKPVVISSNLDPEDLRDRYDTRIYSRILGKYYHKYLYGNDVRMQL